MKQNGRIAARGHGPEHRPHHRPALAAVAARIVPPGRRGQSPRPPGFRRRRGREADCGEVRFIYRLALSLQARRHHLRVATAVQPQRRVPGAERHDASCRRRCPRLDAGGRHRGRAAGRMAAGGSARPRAASAQADRGQRAGGALPVRHGDRIRWTGGLPDAHFRGAKLRHRLDAARKAVGEHARRGAPEGRSRAAPATPRLLCATTRRRSIAACSGCPTSFLATKALSFSTYGSARLANHPYTELLSEQDLPGLRL